MAPLQGGHSSFWSGETAGNEHAGSSSPSESSSNREMASVSDTTLNEADEDEESISSQSDAVIGSEPSHGVDIHTPNSPTLFPFHLISGCSTAGRTMCTSSGSLTSQEVKSVLELRGTSSRGWVALMHHWTPQPARWTLDVRHRSHAAFTRDHAGTPKGHREPG